MSEQSEQQSVIKVRKALALLGARGEVRALDDSARTAKEAADALGIEVGQIASSLIFLGDGVPVLVIASGGHRVDTLQLAAILEVSEITKASADQVRKATGFAIGGVAPVATRTHAHDRRHRPGPFDEVGPRPGIRTTSSRRADELLRITAGSRRDRRLS
jgi:hypothetical protein